MISIQDPDKLVKDGNSIADESKKLQEEITKIYSVIDDLKQSWVGDSSKRFTTNIESFKEDLEKFAKVVGEFGELISAVGTDYQNLEKEL